MPLRELAPGQIARVMIASTTGEAPVEVFRTDDLLVEAPNWTLDGRWLILNGDGRLWRLASDGRSGLVPLDLDGVPDLNNDHVLAPDGEHIFLSANDWQLYQAPLAGGPVRQITDGHGVPPMHFLHGVSPDGTTLAYIGLEPEGDDWWARANVFVMPVAGGPSRRLTDSAKPYDGSEYSPDGQWIYCNTEAFSSEPGHAQIARMRPDGSEEEPLTFDERVNWFPHPSPDGSMISYLSFPPGTVGHPPDRPIEIRLVRDGDWSRPETLVTTFGGQGTLNVNSWAPDSNRFAYVDYPIG